MNIYNAVEGNVNSIKFVPVNFYDDFQKLSQNVCKSEQNNFSRIFNLSGLT